jgi:hypothetical protein
VDKLACCRIRRAIVKQKFLYHAKYIDIITICVCVCVCEKNTACSRIYHKSAVQTSTYPTAIKGAEANNFDALISHQIRSRLPHTSSRIIYKPHKCLTRVKIHLLSTGVVQEM